MANPNNRNRPFTWTASRTCGRCISGTLAGRMSAVRRSGCSSAPVDLCVARVLLRDRGGRLVAADALGDEHLERVPPDRAPDREAGETGHGGAGAQPAVDRVAIGAAAEHDAPGARR